MANVLLQPTGFSKPNTTVHLNSTCQQCLCNYFNTSVGNNYLVLNYFTNETRQYFSTFPISYTLKQSNGTKLYFLQSIFPNVSNCCTPNITEVLTRLQNVTPKVINLTYSPGGFGYDINQPNKAVAIGFSVGNLIWFNPTNLSIIQNGSVWTTLSIVLYNGSLFTSRDTIPTIYVLDSQTMSEITNITHSSLSSTRKYIFFNDSTTMIATAQSNWSLSVFNMISPTNYVFQESISFPFPNAHSVAKVNETFFYASSLGDSTVLAYSYQNATWKYSVLVNSMIGIEGSHITLDDCGRIWHVTYHFGLYIYDSSGVKIASWNITQGSDTLYDILLLPNYILLVMQGTAQQIIQFDPQILCT